MYAIMQVAAQTDKCSSEALQNEVLQKIGRNVLLFQQIEAVLKHPIVHGSLAHHVSETPASQEQQLASLTKQTMGQLATQFLGNVSSCSEEVASEPETAKGMWLSFTYKVRYDHCSGEELKNTLTTLVSERNETIHQILPRLDTSSCEGMKAAIYYLDQQHEKTLPVFAELKLLVTGLEQCRKHVAAYLASEECQKQFDLCFLRASPFVAALHEAAQQNVRSDGWVDIAWAGKVIRQKAPEEFTALKARYGEKTLRGLILATELFDVYDEPTPKGGFRALYRRKPD